MGDFLEFENHYISGELLVLVPMLYILGKYLDQTKINNNHIPMILLSVSVFLTGIYTFATCETGSFQAFLMAIFMSAAHGVLLAGGSVFGGVVFQSVKANGSGKQFAMFSNPDAEPVTQKQAQNDGTTAKKAQNK